MKMNITADKARALAGPSIAAVLDAIEQKIAEAARNGRSSVTVVLDEMRDKNIRIACINALFEAGFTAYYNDQGDDPGHYANTGAGEPRMTVGWEVR